MKNQKNCSLLQLDHQKICIYAKTFLHDDDQYFLFYLSIMICNGMKIDFERIWQDLESFEYQ